MRASLALRLASCVQASCLYHGLGILVVWLHHVGSFMPRWVSYIECYHVVIADTNVIEPIADGIAGLAYGLTWAGSA